MDSAPACASLCTSRPLMWSVTPEVAGASPVAPARKAAARRLFFRLHRPSRCGAGDMERSVERRRARCGATQPVGARDAPRMYLSRRASRRSSESFSTSGGPATAYRRRSRPRVREVLPARSGAALGRRPSRARALRPPRDDRALGKTPHQRPPRRPPDRAQGVADLPERRSPQTDEERAPLRVSALVLIDGLRTDPEADAKAHRAERERVELRPAETDAAQQLDDHHPPLPTSEVFSRIVGRVPGSCRAVSAPHRATSLDGSALARRDRLDVLALHVADDADAPQ